MKSGTEKERNTVQTLKPKTACCSVVSQLISHLQTSIHTILPLKRCVWAVWAHCVAVFPTAAGERAKPGCDQAGVQNGANYGGRENTLSKASG